MKRKLNLALVALFLLALPLSAAAAMQGNVVVLGTVTQNGVDAVGHLMTLPEAAAQGGTAMGHRFMVTFNDAKSGAPITEGLVALKVTDPAGKTADPVRLMPMTMGATKGFSAAVDLTASGTYSFEVGCKLPDGHKRQFTFTYAKK